ncbi:acyl-CoA dehydrogenase family protein [Xanthobacter dioxanivorans]|nr:acyl-CoA dehydrogenase family protein [Xanthobacter dioxanivorans]
MFPRSIFEAEHEMFRETARRFVGAEVAPHVDAWRRQGHVDRAVFRKAGEAGLLLMWADESLGGSGIADLRFDQILQEEVVRGGDPGFYQNLHSQIVAPYIGHFGSPEQKRRFLPGAVSGETILALAMTEPSAGSDVAAIRTTAEDKGDHWLLNGSKTYISNGILADVVIVAARTDREARHGIGLFIVERDMEGFARGRKLGKLGLPMQDTAELFFNDVKLPKENLIGAPDRGFAYMAELLANERLQVAIGSLAHAQAAFDLTLDFIRERRAFGKPVGAMQNSRFVMAALRTRLDATQAFVDQCVMLANAGRLTADVAAEVKLLASELENDTIDDCLQLHGGAGYMDEYRISRMYADARVSRIFAGTSEIMKEIIGRALGLDERKLR